jgi:hypothetical protein
VVEAFDRVGAGRDLAERLVQLRQGLELDRNVEFGQMRRPEAELAPGDAVPDARPAVFEPVEIGPGGAGEIEIADAVLEVEPGVVKVQGKRDTSVAFSVMNSKRAGLPSFVALMPRLIASLIWPGSVTRSP